LTGKFEDIIRLRRHKLGQVAILTDSLACLPPETVKQYDIGILPINIRFGDKIYRDSIDLSPTEAYRLFSRDPDLFSTSPASPAQYLEALREARKRAQNILCFTVSSKLSTVYNVASLAGEQLSAVFPETKVKVIDSETVLAAEGFIALAAAQEAAGGRDLTDILRKVDAVKSNVSFILVLETVRHVYRTGRVPKIAAQAASVLPVKAILTVSNGIVHPLGVARNMKQGIDHILTKLKRKVGDSPVHIAVMHAYSAEEGEKLKERVAAEFNCAELWLTEVSPVVGYALGAGALGFAYYTDSSSINS
jgi:DegV family protein with EDD domain